MTCDVRWHVVVTMVTVKFAPAFVQLQLALNTSVSIEDDAVDVL